jgi:enoyl-CoA hydratase
LPIRCGQPVGTIVTWRTFEFFRAPAAEVESVMSDAVQTDAVPTQAVLTEYSGGVAVITINRPEARNAINREVAFGLAAALETLDARDDLVVGIITGAGGYFSAGMDLKAFLTGEVPHVPGRGFAGLVEAPPAKPLIAAVEGPCLAGGFEIALTCDLIVAAEDAKFGIPEVKRGLVAAAGGLFRLPEKLPYAIAMELALTGEFMDCARAKGLGLINKVTAKGGALEGARQLAASIAANGPLAVRATKQILAGGTGWPVEERFARQRAFIDPVFASEDAKEGPRAFAEKRAPKWTGR